MSFPINSVLSLGLFPKGVGKACAMPTVRVARSVLSIMGVMVLRGKRVESVDSFEKSLDVVRVVVIRCCDEV